MTTTTPLENGCFYHIYNRGNNGDIIFKEESNYQYFLSLLKKYILPKADIYSYCLLNNHFHLMVKIRQNESSAITSKPEQSFSNFFNAYAKAFNQKYERTGKLFQERFRRKKIGDDFYFTEIIYYIHANPQKHRIIQDFRDYPYSSYHIMLSSKETELKREEVLEWFGGKHFFEEYHADKHNFLTEINLFERLPPHLAGFQQPARCGI